MPEPFAEHCAAQVDDRLSLFNDAEAAKPIFSTQDHATSTYVRNPDCWLADVDLTAISPWNSGGAHLFAGVLISRRHITFAILRPGPN